MNSVFGAFFPRCFLGIFPSLLLPLPHLVEMCCWQQIQSKHIFTGINEIGEVKH